MPLDNTGLSTDLEVVNSAVQSMGGGDRRSRNEAIRTGLSDIEGFKQQNPEAVNQALQPAQQAYQNQQQYTGLKDTYDKNVKQYNDLRSTYDTQKANYASGVTNANNTLNNARYLPTATRWGGDYVLNSDYNTAKNSITNSINTTRDYINKGYNGAWYDRLNTNIQDLNNLNAAYSANVAVRNNAVSSSAAKANSYYKNLTDLFTNTSNSVAPLNTAYQKTQPHFNNTTNKNPMDRV